MKPLAAIFALACCTACGSSGAAPLRVVSSVRWIGLDARPLAVGSALTVSFEAAGDGGAIAYSVRSTAPAVIAVVDQGDQRLLLQVLSAGTARLDLVYGDSETFLDLAAAVPSGVTFSDPGHLAAGIAAQLPPAFAVWAGGQETVQGVVVGSDAANHLEVLNSWGLTQGSGKGQIAAVPSQPERFTLAGLTNTGAGTFVAGLIGAQATDLTFAISIVNAPSAVALSSRTDPQSGAIFVLAEGLAADQRTPVFGVDDWQFTCAPAAVCSLTPLTTAAVRLDLPAGSPPGSVTLTVASAKQRLGANLPLP